MFLTAVAALSFFSMLYVHYLQRVCQSVLVCSLISAGAFQPYLEAPDAWENLYGENKTSEPERAGFIINKL